MRPPARTSSGIVSGLKSNIEIVSPASLTTFPSNGNNVITSPVFIFETSHWIGNAPESSAVLKKIGAIFPPKITPPVRLFGMFGMSSPINHCKELIADLRDEPVPTTSPT